jgi:beta-galactosidase/beta-glucuronidase
MKTKFVCVSPISKNAKNDFVLSMNNFHSCRVKKEDDNSYYLESLNKEYSFSVNKNGDSNWRIEK